MAPGAAGGGIGGNIKVVVRCRPFNGREIDRGAKCVVSMKDGQTILTPPDNLDPKGGKGGKDFGGPKVFAFDRSYWSFDKKDPTYAGQDNLHKDLGKPLLDNAFQGYNNCIFAYGQTGSGKSYSMMGYGAEYGVIPKICQDMFVRIGGLQKDKSLNCTVEVSYLEIYNERVRDLLNPSTKGNLKVREHPSTGPYVEDLAKLVVTSFNDIEHLMDEGNKARTVAATAMNETSSRSHAVFTVMLTQKRHDAETKMDTEKVAKISLVDLAGSERANSTGATGARLKEGAEINRSLSTLGRVIAALADLSTPGKKKKGAGSNQVPYRDSVLTWLLKDSLGGNSMTAMIAAISPADINFEETLSTLRYADSAKRIKNHAVVNEDPNARMIRELKEELASLRTKLGGGSGGSGSGLPAEETYPEGTPLEQQIVTFTSQDGTVKKVSKAEIVEQLNQSEKLYTEINQTWEQKLQKTEEIHKEREAALEELGISIEKGFVGLHTPKKMPHLVNLSDDPLLAECLVYNLKPGTTHVGNVETNPANAVEEGTEACDIRLNGSRILHAHCSFENTDDVVTLIPKEGAAVMVNGKRITEPKRLRSGYRIILGDFHIFRFNHPMEAKAERAEQSSLLRHSVTATQLAEMERMATPSPSDRNYSKAISEMDGESGESPSTPAFQGQGDSDWSFARREAASAILGSDQKIAGLTDDELNILFEDIQKARMERKSGKEMDDDLDSVISFAYREKYLSNGTLDNFSLDTALTVPSTPPHGEVGEKMREVRDEMQVELDQQKEAFQEQLKAAEAANVEVEAVKKEKQRMEATLAEVKEAMLRQLEVQRKEFEAHIEKFTPTQQTQQKPSNAMSEQDRKLAEGVIAHWRERKYVLMAETILKSAAPLKEAQIMSQEMDESVFFQFAIIDHGHALCSSYDMVLNSIESDDYALEDSRKPCVAVRVINYKSSVVHLWSLEKLHERVRLMHQMHQYMDHPDYLQHFRLDNPFMETCMPEFTLIGYVDVPLAAVFESRVQDFTLDVLSPYMSSVVGITKLDLEPSSARAPKNMLKFNVVMHEMIGFAEREGTDVHAQLFIPGISDEAGATTTQMIHDFDEGPVRFESVHSMSVPLDSSDDVSLRVSIFSKVSSMHLDKLLSWDDMRDAPLTTAKKRKSARIAENQFHGEEKHDVFARVQILELDENGDYAPVEVFQINDIDAGSFQLHQGLQRRVVINLSHNSGEALQWQDVTNIRVGRVQLIDHVGKTPDLSSHASEIALKLVNKPVFKANANGTCNVTIVGQWDSSLHGSLLLDRVTAEKYRVRMSLHWDVVVERLTNPMSFSLDVACQILSRSYVRQTGIFASMFQNVRIVHSTAGIFSLRIRPAPVKRVGDLWRMSTQHEYVKGEESLTNWTPRGVSLVRDYIKIKKRRKQLAEVEAVKTVLRTNDWPSENVPPTNGISNGDGHSDGDTGSPDESLKEEQMQTLTKSIELWRQSCDPSERILAKTNTEPPSSGAPPSPSEPATPPRLQGTVKPVTRNPTVLKGGYLLVPSSDATRWVRRFVELRRPYLHIHSVPEGEQLSVVSLRNSRVDHQPQIAKLLQGSDGKREAAVFAIFGRDNTWLFSARSEREKVDWIWRIDQSYFGGGGGGASGSGSGESGEDDRWI